MHHGYKRALNFDRPLKCLCNEYTMMPTKSGLVILAQQKATLR